MFYFNYFDFILAFHCFGLPSTPCAHNGPPACTPFKRPCDSCPHWVVGPRCDAVTGLRYGSERWWRHWVAGSTARCGTGRWRHWVVGGATAWCGTVRYGSIDQSDLSISAGAHFGPIRFRFFFLVVKYGISQIRILYLVECTIKVKDFY